MFDNNCIFCKIANFDPQKQIIKTIDKSKLFGANSVVIFEPLNPCVPGHLLFVPDVHINNIGDTNYYAPNVTASVYKAVNLYLQENPQECNIITNNGSNADQTVFHIHVHLIPRKAGDDVNLPWTYQKSV